MISQVQGAELEFKPVMVRQLLPSSYCRWEVGATGVLAASGSGGIVTSTVWVHAHARLCSAWRQVVPVCFSLLHCSVTLLFF